MYDYNDIRIKSVRRMADGFRQFSRLGRWGTCADCPKDTSGHAYPEFCVNTNRYDHQLDAAGLTQQFEVDLRQNKERASSG